MRKLDITRDARKFITELQAKQFRQVGIKMLSLLENAQPPDARPLVGNNNYWRTDVGEFRIVYEFDETTVYVIVIGKRNDDEVYKRLDRL